MYPISIKSQIKVNILGLQHLKANNLLTDVKLDTDWNKFRVIRV